MENVDGRLNVQVIFREFGSNSPVSTHCSCMQEYAPWGREELTLQRSEYKAAYSSDGFNIYCTS